MSKTPKTISPEDAYNAPLEKAFDQIATPFEEFIHNQASSGLVLIVCAIIALVVANSPLAKFYEHLQHLPFAIQLGSWELKKSLHHWINDGLMAIFFFVVGLEIKREILVGELADIRKAVLPVTAAIGGMVVPALVYVAFNAGGDIQGWGIPMATDIAFAVGLMVLLGGSIPRSLITFLVALAIVDDLGAVTVIALFYTENINLLSLAAAAGTVVILIGFNLVGIRHPIPYFLVAVLLWIAMLYSGVHATLAGVIGALTVPARPKYHARFFSDHVRTLMDRFDESYKPEESIISNEQQRALLQTLENATVKAESPLQRLEHQFHLPVAFLIIPIFALMNAGNPIQLDGIGETLSHPVTLGIITGLVLGKLVGIAGFSWLIIKLGIARLPNGASMSQIVGVAMFGGIGFTMSIFIADLAFTGNAELLVSAKTGILLASLIAGLSGFFWLRWIAKPPQS
ncbi:MAG: Na+/H+ antiporter NhaA [Acidiferrobacterales bacterium]|jgi:NhaA family Na+:H+ antiporter|nr:Na+/H+ antiporter NhaA [Acidiferrobacterales bacterium]